MQKLLQLVDTITGVYSSVMRDRDHIPPKPETFHSRLLNLVKQTLECAIFIREYFPSWPPWAFTPPWADDHEKIGDLSDALTKLKESLHVEADPETVFVSTVTFRMEEVYTLRECIYLPS
jgi:hypothetical protein